SDGLARRKRLEHASAARDAVLEKLIELADIPLPDGVVAEEIQSRREAINAQLDQIGMSLKQYLENEGQSKEEYEEDLDNPVRDALVDRALLEETAMGSELSVIEVELP